MIWKHGEVFASHSTDLLTVALAFVKDHTPTASGAGARLASYLAPSPALLHALPYGSRVAVSDVVAEHDCDHRSPMFLLAGDHILLGSWNLTEHDGCNAIVYLNRQRVVAALIQLPRQPEYAWVFQRGPNSAFSGCWEFPGGKVEPGEDDRTALARELEEELAWSDVAIGEHIATAYVPGHDVALYSVDPETSRLPTLRVHSASTHWRIKDQQLVRREVTPAMPFFLEVLSLRFRLHPLHFDAWQAQRQLSHFEQSEAFNPYIPASVRQHERLRRVCDDAWQAWRYAGAPLHKDDPGVPKDTRTWF